MVMSSASSSAASFEDCAKANETAILYIYIYIYIYKYIYIYLFIYIHIHIYSICSPPQCGRWHAPSSRHLRALFSVCGRCSFGGLGCCSCRVCVCVGVGGGVLCRCVCVTCFSSYLLDGNIERLLQRRQLR